MPDPQSGWQPQFRWPNAALEPCTRSAQSPNVVIIEIGNQSRCGSLMPVCRLMSWARSAMRVALRRAPLVRDLLVAPRERHRLERDERDLLRVVEGELDDAPDLLVVDAVDDRRHEHDVDAVLVQVLDRAQLHVEQVRDAAVLVRRVADAVELQVDEAQPGLGSLAAELGVLGELDAVGRRLHAVEAQLLAVRDGLEEVRRQRGLAARELHRHLALRLVAAARSRMALISSHSGSWTKPTWLASVKHGSHIMLQRLVRSTVSTVPRP